MQVVLEGKADVHLYLTSSHPFLRRRMPRIFLSCLRVIELLMRLLFGQGGTNKEKKLALLDSFTCSRKNTWQLSLIIFF